MTQLNLSTGVVVSGLPGAQGLNGLKGERGSSLPGVPGFPGVKGAKGDTGKKNIIQSSVNTVSANTVIILFF